MSNRVTLSPRDVSLLRLLSWTPATTGLILRASVSFDGESFVDERRIRERLQALVAAGFVRFWPTAQAGGGLKNYYKLTPAGYQRLFGAETSQPSRAYFSEISPSLFDHTLRLAEAIVEIVRACHLRRVTIERFARENELSFRVGDDLVQPDCFFRLTTAGRAFNLAFEIDNSTESLDSHAVNSVDTKLRIYHAYQDSVLSQWLAARKTWEKPRFRVVFLTRSVERAYHILAQAAVVTRHKSRRVVYAATHQDFLNDPDPLFSPIFLDHLGNWQSLIDLHPTAPYGKARVRLARAIGSPFGIV